MIGHPWKPGFEDCDAGVPRLRLYLKLKAEESDCSDKRERILGIPVRLAREPTMESFGSTIIRQSVRIFGGLFERYAALLNHDLGDLLVKKNKRFS